MAAAAATIAPFTVNLGGLGGFPAGRAPRVLWASIATGGERIEALFAELEAALVARGIPGEARAFHPHVTLARARDPQGAKELLDVMGAGPAFGEVRVEALTSCAPAQSARRPLQRLDRGATRRSIGRG